ncbi:MAG: lysine--tRNA ligase [Candidatus Abyssobacteria bacterium SURF_5]|uniref:Lysine--tRNA ligase n=1 Tax=Abyssobacteria bacterium (strain SURF_5) TaxID=2093360 RepID=A0A3A4NSR8_ABYX5|nr:MAG: lysine--tRNA ligase [Candidatus Abyssubacteria bacterium SURF_5]
MEEKQDLYAQRLEKLSRIRQASQEPYTYSYARTHTVQQAYDEFEKQHEAQPERTVRLAGRITALRLHGKSAFADLKDDSGKIQLFFGLQDVGGDQYEFLTKLINVGDFLGVEGTIFTTRTGQVTVRVGSFLLLTKTLRPLPEKWHGLKDVEIRLRRRYLDLLANVETGNLFRRRSEIIRHIRGFLDARGYMEVETPMLHPIPGGASARPFITHYNALDRDFYLRVAPELYLKRLLVGGFEKVYEINRNFRNEGVSNRHNPEFTMLELYEAYVDYEAMMELVEKLVSFVVKTVLGKPNFTYQGNDINIEPPWPRVSFFEAIRRFADVDLEQTSDSARARDLVAHLKLDLEDSAGYGKICDEVLKSYVVPKMISPTFLIDYPLELSPLAKGKRGSPRLTERFQPFVGGLEIGNAFSELNDPLEQRARFERQMQLRARGDEEAQTLDEDFITALEYGMPPAGGLGIGIDRLVMLLTDSPTIKEVILFPQLRTVNHAIVEE